MLLGKYSDLSLLRYVEISTTAAGQRHLLHWVPDYRHQPDEREPVYAGHLFWDVRHGKRRFYNATGVSGACIIDIENLFLLSPAGIRAGTITKITEACPPLNDLSFVCSSIASDGTWESLAHECWVDGIYPPTGEPVGVAYARTRLIDYLPNAFQPENRRARAQPLASILQPNSSTYEMNGDSPGGCENSDITVSILLNTSCKRLCITNSGYLGLENRSCSVGDEVFLFLGRDMPFILRKLTTGMHVFKREACFHGIVDGEYLLKFQHDRDAITDEEWLDSLAGEDPPPLLTVQGMLSWSDLGRV